MNMKKVIESIKSFFGLSDDKKTERYERELDESINVVVKNGIMYIRSYHSPVAVCDKDMTVADIIKAIEKIKVTNRKYFA